MDMTAIVMASALLHYVLFTHKCEHLQYITVCVCGCVSFHIYSHYQMHSFTSYSVKPCPHQQQCRSNIVECSKSNNSFDKVETN